jgi:uncharacterized membrane protein YgcG
VHRRLLLPLAAVTTAAVLASGCGKQQSAAVRVGDQSVSQQELFDELELIVTDDAFRTITFGPEDRTPLASLQGTLGPESYSQFMIGAVVTQRVEYLVAGDVLEDNGIEITKQDRVPIENAIDEALKRGGGNIKSLPPAYKEDLVEGLTRLQVLQRELGDDEFQQQMRDALTSAHVEIASHFGTWDPERGGVVPPSGPLQAPGSQDDGSGGGSNGNSGGGSGGSGGGSGSA